MKLLVENSSALLKSIDETYAAENSLVLRYRNAVQFDDRVERNLAFRSYLLESSLREGVRIFHLMTYQGVEIFVLDETSRMAAGSLKGIDGCLTTAFCRMEGTSRIVFESGGNTGIALTLYGQHAGLETFFFCPIDNIDLLDSRLFNSDKAHLIAVEDRGLVKEFTTLFARKSGIRRLPDKSWRYLAAMFRGLFILEQMLTKSRFDWISQTVSAAFGPIGIYRVLSTFQSELSGMPRFLGIQQEANCPMVKAWKPETATGKMSHGSGNLLTRVMYDHSPGTYQTYDDLHELLLKSRGDLLTINEAEFHTYIHSEPGYGKILDLLQAQGTVITLRSGQVLEKTGMIALAGTLKAIEAGTIQAGSHVLCCLTGGTRGSDGRARPERTVRTIQDVLDYVEMVQGGG